MLIVGSYLLLLGGAGNGLGGFFSEPSRYFLGIGFLGGDLRVGEGNLSIELVSLIEIKSSLTELKEFCCKSIESPPEFLNYLMMLPRLELERISGCV
jgi:hypothetical protein